MKELKKYLTEGLVRVTVLLSLVGVRDLDLDFYLPRSRETIPGSSSYSQIPSRCLRDTWEGSRVHPKHPDLDSFTAKRLLGQVRALGGTRVPRTELSAWLVHSGGGDDDTGSVHSGPGSNESSGADSLASGCHEGSSQQPSNITHHSCTSGKTRPHVGASSSSGSTDDTKEIDTTEPALFFEDFIQLLAQTENALQGTSENTLNPSPQTSINHPENSAGELWQDLLTLTELNISLEDIHPVSSHYNHRNSPVQNDVGMMVSPDFNLQEAGHHENLNQRPNFTSELNININSEEITNPTSFTHVCPSFDNSSRNITNQDLLSGFENVFDEINMMSFALEEGFDPLEVSALFEEPDSDSGLSLNSSQSPTSVSISDASSGSFGEEGAAGYSSDSESGLYGEPEGTVISNWLENTSSCLDYQEGLNYDDNITLQNVRRNHTYVQLPKQSESVLEHPCSLSAKQSKQRSTCIKGIDKHLSRDERCTKSLQIPFSVEEIVSMPVEMFNNLLSKHCLAESQVTVIRDIRRRGKNKVAAQTCRKRKLNVILNLEDDVGQLKTQREKLLKEQVQCSKSVSNMKQKLNDLYRDVFSKLRDEHGNPVNPSQYALHCNSDGSVLVVPKRLFKSEKSKM
ncbi:hypothetical protein GDO86_011709 [Hymenochirus boettgeri]|uniref:BZIP domain-containing protein n=1 Tax=Hymenochirus boettgeri TaxID=247094 RepID=A0A8T2JI37_9PIPI|nr:hypothetical protein GDO86_011709 [Hymenochirus boettgeri]